MRGFPTHPGLPHLRSGGRPQLTSPEPRWALPGVDEDQSRRLLGVCPTSPGQRACRGGVEDSKSRGQTSHAQPRGSLPPVKHPSQGPGWCGETLPMWETGEAQPGVPQAHRCPRQELCRDEGLGWSCPLSGAGGLSPRVGPGRQRTGRELQTQLGGSLGSGSQPALKASSLVQWIPAPKSAQVGQGRQKAQQEASRLLAQVAEPCTPDVCTSSFSLAFQTRPPPLVCEYEKHD